MNKSKTTKTKCVYFREFRKARTIISQRQAPVVETPLHCWVGN